MEQRVRHTAPGERVSLWRNHPGVAEVGEPFILWRRVPVSRVVLRVLPIFGVSLFAGGMSIFFAQIGKSSPPGSGVIPAALAFGAVSLLGTAVGYVVGVQERRIQELERRLPPPPSVGA